MKDVQEEVDTKRIDTNEEKVDIEVLAEEVVQEFREYESWCRLNAVYLQSSVGAKYVSNSTEGPKKARQDKSETRVQQFETFNGVEETNACDDITEYNDAENLVKTVLVSTDTKDFSFSLIEEVKISSVSGMPQQIKQPIEFACETCDERYNVKKHLNEHMKTHFNIFFECKFCGKVLKSQTYLDRHLLVTHSRQMDVKQILLPTTTTRSVPLCFSWTRGQCGADKCPRAFRHYYSQVEAAPGSS